MGGCAADFGRARTTRIAHWRGVGKHAALADDTTANRQQHHDHCQRLCSLELVNLYAPLVPFAWLDGSLVSTWLVVLYADRRRCCLAYLARQRCPMEGASL